MTMTGHATDRGSASGPDTAAELTALATWIAEQLGDETADRQWIAESAAARVRDITLQMLGAVELERRRAHAELDEGQRRVLAAALADAIDFREPRGVCMDCDQHDAGLCADHADDYDRAAGYRALARALGDDL